MGREACATGCFTLSSCSMVVLVLADRVEHMVPYESKGTVVGVLASVRAPRYGTFACLTCIAVIVCAFVCLQVAGLMGGIVGPTVGAISDRHTSRFGRRTPFLGMSRCRALLVRLSAVRTRSGGDAGHSLVHGADGPWWLVAR
jgi:hypothetical protein